jgi:hypothetical protein
MFTLSREGFRPRPTLPRLSGITSHNRSAWASHSTFSLRQSTSFFSHYYALFCTPQDPNSFPFMLFRTLCTKHPGWGIPCLSATSVHSALKSTRASAPPDPFGTRHHPLTPIPFRIRTYRKPARNPFRMNTSKTQDLKLFRMNTYKGNNLLDSSTVLAYYLTHGDQAHERTQEPARSDSLLLESR